MILTSKGPCFPEDACQWLILSKILGTSLIFMQGDVLIHGGINLPECGMAVRKYARWDSIQFQEDSTLYLPSQLETHKCSEVIQMPAILMRDFRR